MIQGTRNRHSEKLKRGKKPLEGKKRKKKAEGSKDTKLTRNRLKYLL